MILEVKCKNKSKKEKYFYRIFWIDIDDSYGYRDIKVIYNSLNIDNKINFSFMKFFNKK